jgi:hypothetical protein
MADHDHRLAAQRLDHGCGVGSKVVQGEAVHRPGALADAARIGTHGGEPGRDQATAEVVEIGRRPTERGDHQNRGAGAFEGERDLAAGGTRDEARVGACGRWHAGACCYFGSSPLKAEPRAVTALLRAGLFFCT